MTVQRGFLITIGSILGFSGMGAVAGYILAVAAPDYYRTVFHISPDAVFHPVQIGLGLGLTEGGAAGLVVGLVIVVTVAWYDSRVEDRRFTSSHGTDSSAV